MIADWCFCFAGLGRKLSQVKEVVESVNEKDIDGTFQPTLTTAAEGIDDLLSGA